MASHCTPLRRFGFPRLAAALAAALLVGACAQTAKKPEAAAVADEDDEQMQTATAERAAAPELPKQELTDQILYEFLLAEIAGQRGNLALSVEAYVDLAKRTRDPRIARRAYEVSASAGALNPAIDAARIWIETDPGSQQATRALAGLLLRANRVDEALPYLEKILAEADANRGEGFMQLNRLVASNPDKATNLRVIQSLAAKYPDLPEAHIAVAQAATTTGDDALALSEVRKAARLRPDWELAALFEAQLLQKQSNAAAAAFLGDYVAKYPKAREVRLAYARTLAGDRRYPEARAQFEQLLNDFPDNADVVFAVALLSIQLEDYATADTNLKRLLAMNYRDRDTVLLYLGQVAEQQKRYPEALQWYGDVGRGEQFMTAQVRQAQVLYKQGDLAAARAFLQKVDAQNNQQRVQLILAEAQLLRDANQPKEALLVVERGLEKLPNDPDLLYDSAMLAEKLDRLDILEANLRKLIRIKPDHAHAYNALGYTFADRNIRLDEAKELVEQALKLSPDDAFIIDSMGWVYYRMGRKDEALAYLRRAYSMRPDAEIAAHLGEVLWETGQRDEARRIWSEAASKTPDNDALQKTIKRFNP